ncbi:MAG: retropepsin-like aspartic protease [Firmicutes bacterium]|nr:retropepsin-like aspartic protease [Bacillota bacterium]
MATTSSTSTSLITISGQIQADSFQFSLPVGRFGNVTPVPFILDTGAYEMTFNSATASSLNLPNLGAVTISGVSGGAKAYRSSLSVQIGDRLFRNVKCIVDPSLPTDNLFGLRFLAFHKLSILLNTRDQTITFLN